MADSYSISEAKNQLPRLVHDLESGGAIQLTRRGRPVAVLLSIEEYRRVSADRRAFWANVAAFRQEHGLDEAGVEPEEWLVDARAGLQTR